MRQLTFLGYIFAAFALVILAGCASGAMTGGTGDDGTGGPIASQQVTEYKLGNGDEIRVSVFGEPELSGDFAVDGAGAISMPLIGTVPVVGLTIPEFQSTVAARLADGYLVNPRVSAEVTNYRPFYILGEVNRPNEYQYNSGLTVMNAVAAAGGFTYRANRRTIFIRSEGDTDEREVQLTTTTIVRPGDTIRVGERIF